MTYWKIWGTAAIVAIGLMGSTVRAEGNSPLSLSFDPMYLSNGTGKSVAADTSMRLRAYGIFSTASGTFDVGDDVPGSRSVIDFEDTLGMDMDKFTGGVLLGLNFGADKRMHLDISYDGFYDYDGDRIVGSISFDGEVYTAEVESDLEIHSGAVNFGYDFWQSDALTLTGNLGVRLFHIDGSIREVLTGREGSLELWAPIPTGGLSLRWDITPNLYARGTANGIYLGDLACYLELGAEVGYDFNQNLGVFVGYRYWAVSVDYNEDALDVDIGSIYAGIEIRM